MTKYLALYMATRAAIDEMMKATPAEQQAGMGGWMKWANDNKSGIVELGAPLGKTKRLAASGLSDTKNEITGYTVVQADSAEAAAKIFKDNPHLQMAGCTIDLIECMVIPGM